MATTLVGKTGEVLSLQDRMEQFCDTLRRLSVMFRVSEEEVADVVLYRDLLRARTDEHETCLRQIRETELLLARLREDSRRLETEVDRSSYEAEASCHRLVRTVQTRPGVPERAVARLRAILALDKWGRGEEPGVAGDSADTLAPLETPRDAWISAQIGGVNVLTWDYQGMNELPEGMEYEVAVAVGEGVLWGAARPPLLEDKKDHPETWHYRVRTSRNPFHHRVTFPDGRPVGVAKGVQVWYRLRVVRGEQAGPWSDLLSVECNRWKPRPWEHPGY